MADRRPPQSFVFAAGESVSIPFEVDQVITGMTARFALKRDPSSDAVVSTAESTATASITDAQECTVGITDENTEDLIGTYRYSIEIEDLNGAKSEIAWGFMTFKPSMV